MHLGALAVFASAPGTAIDAANILEVLSKRFSAAPRLRMRVCNVSRPLGGAVWIPDENFDIRRHLHRQSLPHQNFATEVKRVAGESMARSLPRDRPPWEICIFTAEPVADPSGRTQSTDPRRHEDAGGTFALLLKMQHALADGMGALAIGTSILDQAAAVEPNATRRTHRLESAYPPRRGLPHTAGEAAGAVASAVRGRLFAAHRPQTFAAPSSGTRRLATAVLDLNDVRTIRAAAGGTVNDVLLAVVAGGLRRWILERGDRLPASPPRALVPASLRRPDRRDAPGNNVAGYLVDLPVAEPQPRARLLAVRRSMDRNRAAGPTRGIGAVAVVIDHLPALAQRVGGPIASRTAKMLFDIAVTTVALPKHELSLGGVPLRELHPIAPLARGQSLAMAICTYGDRAYLTLNADGRVPHDLDRVADGFNEEVKQLLQSIQRD
jgi:WS/DGAT/MGAT family acyltransferase